MYQRICTCSDHTLPSPWGSTFFCWYHSPCWTQNSPSHTHICIWKDILLHGSIPMEQTASSTSITMFKKHLNFHLYLSSVFSFHVCCLLLDVCMYVCMIIAQRYQFHLTVFPLTWKIHMCPVFEISIQVIIHVAPVDYCFFMSHYSLWKST